MERYQRGLVLSIEGSRLFAERWRVRLHSEVTMTGWCHLQSVRLLRIQDHFHRTELSGIGVEVQVLALDEYVPGFGVVLAG